MLLALETCVSLQRLWSGVSPSADHTDGAAGQSLTAARLCANVVAPRPVCHSWWLGHRNTLATQLPNWRWPSWDMERQDMLVWPLSAIRPILVGMTWLGAPRRARASVMCWSSAWVCAATLPSWRLRSAGHCASPRVMSLATRSGSRRPTSTVFSRRL